MKYYILDNTDTVKFSEIEALLSDFIKKYVAINRQERWLFLSKKQKKFSQKFGDLWDHIDTEQSKPLSIANLSKGVWLYFCPTFEDVFRIKSEDLETVCLHSDGIAFLPCSGLAILFTHECTEYVFHM